ncbi:unnamed protein product [Ectocarpus sp. 8 AP-2014]
MAREMMILPCSAPSSRQARRSRGSRRLRLAFFGCEDDPRSGSFCMEGLLDVRQGSYGVKWRSESAINTILGFAK